MKRRTPLSKRRLEAIIEALVARLAEPIGSEYAPSRGDDITREDYENALNWAIDRSRPDGRFGYLKEGVEKLR